jgi:hypothetical protein
MGLIDSLLLTLVSTLICFTFPKLLSIILTAKTKLTATSTIVSEPQDANKEVPSYL